MDALDLAIPLVDDVSDVLERELVGSRFSDELKELALRVVHQRVLARSSPQRVFEFLERHDLVHTSSLASYDGRVKPELDDAPTPVEVPGPRRTSINLPLWERSCRELSVRLRLVPTVVRVALANELDEIAEKFARFSSSPPSDEERVAVLARFMDLQSSALDVLASHIVVRR